MDINKGYYILARTVIEGALYDIRKPEVCSDCGPITSYTGVDAEWSERTKSKLFLESPICIVWCKVAELDPDMVREAIHGQEVLKRTICKAPQRMRLKNCVKLQEVPTNRVIFADKMM